MFAYQLLNILGCNNPKPKCLGPEAKKLGDSYLDLKSWVETTQIIWFFPQPNAIGCQLPKGLDISYPNFGLQIPKLVGAKTEGNWV